MEILDDLPKEEKKYIEEYTIRTPLCNLLEEATIVLLILDTVILLASIFYYRSIDPSSQEVVFYMFRVVPAMYVFLWSRDSKNLESGRLITMTLLTPLMKFFIGISFIIVVFTFLILFFGIPSFFVRVFDGDLEFIIWYILYAIWTAVHQHYLRLTLALSDKFDKEIDENTKRL